MKLHGYFGLTIILGAEIFLFSGDHFVGSWFTPLVWTGYILFVDALVYKLRGRSFLITDRVEFLIVALVSIAGWWLFEFYNAPRFWRSGLELWWHYHNLEANPYLRRVGYDWAFATIYPALFLTAQFFAATIFSQVRAWRPIRLSSTTLYLVLLLGLGGTLAPLVLVSAWFAPVVWLSFIFLLDPLNYIRRWPSIIGDLEHGKYGRLLSLLASGATCGVLWEFWNYWALAKWTYTVPYLGNIKIFEMPVFGYFGFPPFAVECWVMYIFFRSLLTSNPIENDSIWIEAN